MANEIRTLLNSQANLKNDWRQDWKEDAKLDWKDDWHQDTFVLGAATAGGGNVGDGTIESLVLNQRNAVSETWTITALSDTEFSVVGSVSDEMDDAEVGVPYDNGIISFTITEGDTPFAADDVFTIAVTDGTPVNSVLPAISDTTPTEEQALTVTTGTWAGAATITYTYQWFRGNAKIAGATTNAYTVTAADIGSKLKVRVRAANAKGTAYVDTAATSDVVAAE